MASQGGVTSPLNIILVKNGSKGDRLLFRYPYVETTKETVTKNTRHNPYALAQADNEKLLRTLPASNIRNGQLFGFPDKVLSNLFAVKTQLCGKKFELKVNDVRFVGHPTLLHPVGSTVISQKRQASTLILFNIIFALRANASHSIVRCYHDLSYRIGVALCHEERRCGYLSKDAKIMLAAHDEVAAMADEGKESPFNLILQRSELAQDLKQVYEDLCSSGFVHLRVNKWLQISFCLPQRVHQLHYRDHMIDVSQMQGARKPEALQACLDSLRPYHAMLLLVNERDLLASLPPDCSPALVRLIQVASPLKSLQELSADADLSLAQVFQLVGHLVYWAQATVIYPLCETNVYVLSPHAPTSMSSALVERFAEKFPGIHLLMVMAEFSLPVSLSQRDKPTNLPYQQVQLLQIIIWLLQHNLLMQLHTYVYLVALINNTLPATDNPPLQVPAITSECCELTHDASTPAVEDGLPAGLTQDQRHSIRKISAVSNPEDLSLFTRLCPYFNGRFHLEEIMYYENIRRTQLLALLDKFREVLVTCEHEDDAVAVFYRHSKIAPF